MASPKYFTSDIMIDVKKEQERVELHRSIWAIADDLRGSVDGWDFKTYVLGTMFYRFISENIANRINANELAAHHIGGEKKRMNLLSVLIMQKFPTAMSVLRYVMI